MTIHFLSHSDNFSQKYKPERHVESISSDEEFDDRKPAAIVPHSTQGEFAALQTEFSEFQSEESLFAAREQFAQVVTPSASKKRMSDNQREIRKMRMKLKKLGNRRRWSNLLVLLQYQDLFLLLATRKTIAIAMTMRVSKNSWLQRKGGSFKIVV